MLNLTEFNVNICSFKLANIFWINQCDYLTYISPKTIDKCFLRLYLCIVVFS